MKPEHWGVPYLSTEAQQRMWADSYLRQNRQSVDLIKYSAQRGMSRVGMERIWGPTLVRLVLG